jgi:predicted acetyltransferase
MEVKDMNNILVSGLITIEAVKIEEKEILRNLLEKYNYEFSQYEKTDVNNLGLYGFDYMDYYWMEKNKFPYFIKINNLLVGFAMVTDHRDINIETDYTMAEFSILFKYRKMGIGKNVVKQLFEKHKGKWQIKFHPKNEISEIFWTNVVKEYTKGNYEIIENNEETIYRDGTIGKVLVFDT